MHKIWSCNAKLQIPAFPVFVMKSVAIKLGVKKRVHTPLFRGKNVLLVEDVIDTGLTMEKLLEVLEGYSPKSLSVTALTKKRRPEVEYWPDYCGFKVPSRHIVGYNYDFNNHYRDMAHVCFLGEKAKEIYPIE